MSDCEHSNFQGSVSVTRLTADEDGPVTGYTTDIRVRCNDCGMPFKFVGLPGGSSRSAPTTSWDGADLRAPIEPAPECNRWEQPLVSGRA